MILQLQDAYESHRVKRNAQQKAAIMADDFPGWKIDDILMRLDGPRKEDGYVDPRHCLVIWARPPSPICELVAWLQNELKTVAPSLWMMPPENLHLTILELAHSLTKPEIEDLVRILKSATNGSPDQIRTYPKTHKSRLLKPVVSFDSAALALSFLPAAGEATSSNGISDEYSYHHLRRDVFELARQAKLDVGSRYIVPSAHVTIARFINHDGFTTDNGEDKCQLDRASVRLLIEKIQEINEELVSDYWPRTDGTIPDGGDWIVGDDKGFTIRRDRVWYGGGEDV
ncbi:hypothetical protein VI817_001873 [Penicillium citrinum]|nr:hypothetical protein VI817_001873 [Penicillium citrinum]